MQLNQNVKLLIKHGGNYTGENNDRHNAENCEHFNPDDEVWSNSKQKIVKSEDVNWI